MDTKDWTPLEYAIAYIKRQWPIFPLHTIVDDLCSCGSAQCGVPGKHPRTPNGFRDATLDETQACKFFTGSWANSNVGISTGPAELLIVDVDPKNGGVESWSKLVTANIPGLLTITSNTGGGGFHVWFMKPQGVRIKSRANILPGIDIRCEGGYIVAPPSLHKSGKLYTFRGGASPGETELQLAPEWLVELCRSKKGKEKPTEPTTDDGWVLHAFRHAGWVLRDIDSIKSSVRCPWADSHSTPQSENGSDTVVFRPNENHNLGWFHCSHAHCAHRTLEDVREVLPASAKASATAAYPPPKTPPRQDDHVHSTRSVDPQDWRGDLVYDKKRKLLACVSNVITILQGDPRWEGVLAKDLFSGRNIFLSPPPWSPIDAPFEFHEQIEDADGTRMVSWMARNYGIAIGSDTAFAAMYVACEKNAFHPVRAYLQSLKWDGVQRLPTMAHVYFGAPESEKHGATAMMRWMIAGVRRVHEPGCQCDSVLVLEGNQGIGKSRALRVFAGESWFADEIGDVSNKDSSDAVRGKWIIEIPELKWAKQNEDSRKAFITRSIDHYRPPYGRVTIDVPRQCILAATTNERAWQTDATGARRYWSCYCEAIDVAAIERDRDQLWAEAMVRYQSGERSWLTEDEAALQIEAMGDRREIDPWEPAVMQFAALNGSVVVGDVLSHIGVDRDRWTQADSRRVCRILRANGYDQIAWSGIRGSRIRVWERVQK